MATRTGFRWITAPSRELIPRLESYRERLSEAVLLLARFFAARIESHLKTTAGWIDRTGAARASLRSFAVRAATGVVIYLVIGVEYGVALMLGTRYMRPFATIQNTMEAFHAPVMRAVRQLVGA